MTTVLMLGPTGAGKGTQAAALASFCDVPHISTGDIFRANIQAETPMGEVSGQCSAGRCVGTRFRHPGNARRAAKARAADNRHPVADLEDAAFRFYLPMARSMAHSVDESVDPTMAEQAAELGLAGAVLGWRQQTSDGFRGFARTTIARQFLGV